jgi:sugar/nucleoside kinase (ribokinase family)
VILSRGEDRAMLTALGAIPALEPGDVLPLVAQARHVHLSSLALQPALAGAVPAVVRAARAAGTTVSADPNWDPRERWALGDALRAVDVIFPNAEEALRFAGRDDGDVEAAAAALASGGALVVVTLGAGGALAHDGDAVVRAAAPDVEVVDTTGAGDTFAAGFLSARLSGAALTEALAFACACGARSVGAVGGTDAQPTRAEAEALLAAGPPP